MTEIWNKIRELLTSRTIWGVVVMLLGAIGVDANGLNDLLVAAGDNLITFVGAVMAVIGYIGRRPKQGFVEVPAIR